MTFEKTLLMLRHIFNAIKYYCDERPTVKQLIRSTGLKVLSPEDTIAHILKTGCSVARFGDGELILAFNGSIYFQEHSPTLQAEIQTVLTSKQSNLLVCFPQCLSINGRNRFLPVYERAWDRLALEFIPKVVKLKNFEKEMTVFGDANISRPYMIFKDRNKHANSVFSKIKQLWSGRDILIVEGKLSRLGIGNDLFADAKSIRRILCPAVNAYGVIDKIVDSVVAHTNGALILIALGPTATILAARLSKLGLQAIDIGHIDVEYMWYKMGAKRKVPIPGKYVHEALDGNGVIPPCEDAAYIESIIDTISG